MGGILPGRAQVFYILSDGTNASSGDQLRKVSFDGLTNNQVASGFSNSVGSMVIDRANNRAFVSNGLATGAKILAINLTTGATTTFLNSASLVQGMAVDAVNGYLYYAYSDNTIATTDQLRRINLDGTLASDTQIATGFASTIGAVALDLANNRAFVGDRRSGAPRIYAVNLSAGTSSIFVTPSTLFVTRGLVVDPVNNYLYYALNDNNGASTSDQLRRIGLNGLGDTPISTSIVSSIGEIALDLPNNRLYVADASTSSSNIESINLATNTSSVLVTPPSGSAVTGLGVLPVCSTFVTGLTPSPSSTITCTNRSLTLTATGGSSYTFTSSGGGNITSQSTSGSAIINAAGTYSVRVTDANGCTMVSTTAISSNTTAPTVNIATASNLTALDCNTTVLSLTASGGVAYLWDNGLTIPTRNAGLPGGTYSVTVTGANGCTTVATKTISQNTTPPPVSLTATDVCAGQSVTLTATGGISSYTFVGGNGVIGFGATNFTTVSGLSAGPYSFTVLVRSSVNSCTNSAVASASVSALPTPTLATSGSLNCVQTSLTLTATGGTSYTFAGPSGGITSQDQTNGTAVVSTAGTYTVTVANASGCRSSTTATVFNAANLLSILLPSSSTGTTGVTIPSNVIFTASGGMQPYNFAISTLPPGLSVTTSSATQLVIGGTPTQTGVFPISVTVTDNTGCSVVSAPYALTVNCPTITLTTPNFSTATVGVNITTSINWSASGGSVPYSFSFSTLPTGLSVVSSSSAFRGLGGKINQAGTYPISLTVTDVNGCLVVAPPYNLTVSCPALSLTTPSYSTALVGRSLPTPLAWEVAGGTSPYSFSFSSFPPGLAIGTTFAHYQELIGTPTQVGTFPISLTVTDANGCSLVNSTYSLTTSCATLALSTTTNITRCGGTGSIAFTTNLPNGTYSLSYVGTGSPRSVSVSSGLISVTGLSAGSYGSFSLNYGSSVCILTVGSTVVLSNPVSPTVGIIPTSGTLTCSQTALTLTASTSGTGVVWSTGAITNSITVNAANTYSVTATDANGCTASTTASVSSNTAAPTLTVMPGSGTLTCSVTSLTLTASGTGTGYSWIGGTTGATLSVSASGNYSVTATGANGCTATTSVVISQSANLPTPGLMASGTLTCSVTAVTLTASGGNSYAFAGPPTGPTGVVSSAGSSATVNADGVYSVTVTNTATGCSNVTITTVQSNTTAPTPGLTHSGTITCATTAVLLAASGGGTYSFSGTGSVASSGSSATVNQGGTFTVTVTGANGCTASATTTVQSNTTAPTAGLMVSGTITCSVPAVTLTASGGGNYAFGGPSFVASSGSSATVNVAGIYSVTVTNTINGCTNSTTVTVASNFTAQVPTVALPFSASTVCQGGNVVVTAMISGSITSYQWLQNGVIVSGQTTPTLTLNAVDPGQAGSYVLVINSGCGSFTSSIFSLTVNPLPVVTLTVPLGSTVVGPGTGVATITVPAPLTGVNFQVFGGAQYDRMIIIDRVNGFEIRQVDTNANGIFPVTRTGPFRLTVTGATGCQRTVEGVVVTR